jgi:arylsulfatase A-like enzyme
MKWLALILMPMLVAAPATAAERPNVLFLFADDQRADTIAAWGNAHIRTPNLDRLVAEGFSFRRNYCFGSNSGAVCVPSRAMLMSGRTWFAINNQLKGVRTFPEMLREQGYRTFMTGKWHNGAESVARVFPDARAVFLGGMNDHTKVPVQDIERGKLVNRRVGEKFSSELFADTTIDFLRGRNGGDDPFFAYVAFTAPHDPRQPPEKYAKTYYDDRPPLPGNFLPQHPFNHGQMTGRDEELAAWPRSREVISDQLAEYYGMITHLDEQVGRILTALKETGLAENTIVIYAADHGLAMGSHGLLGKQSVYEHSMRCPLIVRGPGVPQGRSTDAMTYLLDLGPTILDLAAAGTIDGAEGKSLRGIWEGKVEKVRDSIFLPYQDLMRAVSDGRWKLIRYPRIDHTQLFDLEHDPLEMKDLAADAAHRGQVERLMNLMEEWRQRVGDPSPLTAEKLMKKEIDLTGRKRQPDQWQPEWIRRKYFGQ